VGGGHGARLNLARLAPGFVGAPPARAEGILLARDQGFDAVSVKGYRCGFRCQISSSSL
jgi:hypothetical protein